MPPDVDAARAFVAGQARPLDQARLAALLGAPGAAAAVLEALEAYAVAGGGYGRGIEPDLRAPEAQPAGAMHALEALADIAPHPAVPPVAVALCDWLESVTLPDGGLPFALPVSDPAGCAPFWVGADPARSSLQITAAVAAEAHRLARHDPAVAAHPWLERATAHCLDAIDAHRGPMPALALMFALRLLQAIPHPSPRAAASLGRLAARIPPSGRLAVEGGADDEFVRPLDLAPLPGDPVRAHLDAAAVDADLRRLAEGQQPDGGWRADWASYSPEAAREWRGYLTVRAVVLLQANGRG